MKLVILSILYLCLGLARADEVKIDLNPSKPVAGEVFQAVFHVYSDSDSQPVINFSPYKVEVVGKNNYGVKTSTIWINGKFTTSREMTIVYELAASEPGLAGLRDISVTVGSKVLRHPSLSINVLKEPEVAADVFVMADVPKKSLYLGEGIVVRYYLYSKVPVSNLDIKKYPKLISFLKRFLQEPENTERVTVDGQLYMRTQIYGVKLFPEKIGELKIDPLQLTAAVVTSRGNDPFGGFGLSRETRQKTLSSEIVKIEVKPLPEEGKTAGFTGLVGKHQIDLQLTNSRLIVNEPLEVKLTVTGGGALENMEAPTILKHPDLEEFESNGDLKIQNADQATKVFDYTYLPKASFNLPPTSLSMTYFDPDSMKYVPVQLSVPEVVVAAGAQSAKKELKKEAPEASKERTFLTPQVPTKLAGPLTEAMEQWKGFLKYINIALAVAALFIALTLVMKKNNWPTFSAKTIPSSFKKGQFSFGEFTRWIEPLISRTGKSPLSVIRDSEMSSSTKTYFIDLLNSNDLKDYSHLKGQFKFVYKSESFKELDKYIKSAGNENTSQSP